MVLYLEKYKEMREQMTKVVTGGKMVKRINTKKIHGDRMTRPDITEKLLTGT